MQTNTEFSDPPGKKAINPISSEARPEPWLLPGNRIRPRGSPPKSLSIAAKSVGRQEFSSPGQRYLLIRPDSYYPIDRIRHWAYHG